MIERRLVLALVTVLVIGHRASAATYYVDYDAGSDANTGLSKSAAWRLCPGMVGYAGAYVHAPGDEFVFKGGTTWPASALPLTLVGSGVDGGPDQYRGDPTWYSGGIYDPPVFDGGGGLGRLLVAQLRSDFVIRGLKFVGVGQGGVKNSAKAVEFAGCRNAEFIGCTLAADAWIGLYIHAETGDVRGNLTIAQNDISRSTQAIVLATGAANTTIEDVVIRDNVIHDLSSQIVSDVHGDGIHTWTSPSTDSTQLVRGLRVFNNTFGGDCGCGDGTTTCWGLTAMIYLEYNTIDCDIYNNLFAYSDMNSIGAFIWLKGNYSTLGIGGGHRILNNTLVAKRTEARVGIMATGSPNLVIKNNVIANFRYSYSLSQDTIAGTEVDYNNVYPTADTVGRWGTTDLVWSSWVAGGRDTHGLLGDPGFVSVTDFSLSPISPCVGVGADLSAYFTYDQGYRVRPTGAGWDLGCFQTGTASPQPAPPRNLHLRQ